MRWFCERPKNYIYICMYCIYTSTDYGGWWGGSCFFSVRSVVFTLIGILCFRRTEQYGERKSMAYRKNYCRLYNQFDFFGLIWEILLYSIHFFLGIMQTLWDRISNRYLKLIYCIGIINLKTCYTKPEHKRLEMGIRNRRECSFFKLKDIE